MQMRKKKNREWFTDACMSWLRVRCALQSAPSLNEDQGGARWTAFFVPSGCINENLLPQPSPPPLFRQTNGIIGDSYILCDLQSICR